MPDGARTNCLLAVIDCIIYRVAHFENRIFKQLAGVCQIRFFLFQPERFVMALEGQQMLRR